MVPPLCKEGIIFTPMLLASKVYFLMITFEIWVMLLFLKMFASHQIWFELWLGAFFNCNMKVYGPCHFEGVIHCHFDGVYSLLVLYMFSCPLFQTYCYAHNITWESLLLILIGWRRLSKMCNFVTHNWVFNSYALNTKQFKM